MRWPRKSAPAQRYWKALGEGDFEAAARLLNAGLVTVGTRNETRKTPLQWATRSGRGDVVEWLLERGAKDTLAPAGDAFVGALESGDPVLARRLLEEKSLPARLSSIDVSPHPSLLRLVLRQHDAALLGKVLSALRADELVTMMGAEGKNGFDALWNPRAGREVAAALLVLLEHLDRFPAAVGEPFSKTLLLHSPLGGVAPFQAALAHLPRIPLHEYDADLLERSVRRASTNAHAGLCGVLLASGNVQESFRLALARRWSDQLPVLSHDFIKMLFINGFLDDIEIRATLSRRAPGALATVDQETLAQKVEMAKPVCKKAVKRL